MYSTPTEACLSFLPQGFAHGISAIPDIVVLGYYFKRRLGFANGFMFAGLGVGVLVFNPFLEWLCAQYGWRGALMIHSATNANILAFGALYRPTKLEKQVLRTHRRISSTTHGEETTSHDSRSFSGARVCRALDKTFAFSSLSKSKLFVVYSLVSVFIFMGFVSSTLFVYPRLVQDLGLPTKTASLVMTAYGISSILARIFHGFLLDYKLITITNLNLISIFVCGLSPVLNPLVSTVSGQLILNIILGGAGGVLDTMVAPVIRQYVPMDDVSNAFGLFFGMTVIGLLMGTQLMGKMRTPISPIH